MRQAAQGIVSRTASATAEHGFEPLHDAGGILDDGLVRAREFLKREPVRDAVVDSAQVARQQPVREPAG